MERPAEGDPAPDFTLPDQDGREHALSDYRGKWVLLYFYPKDDTFGCTKEACGIRDHFEHFDETMEFVHRWVDEWDLDLVISRNRELAELGAEPGMDIPVADLSETTRKELARVDFEGDTLTVDAEGRLEEVRIRRWTDDRGDGTPGYAPFVVDDFREERTFGGYTIPTRLRAGWQRGAPAEPPFFYAEIEEATYLQASGTR